jgi:hypothetical protein
MVLLFANMEKIKKDAKNVEEAVFVKLHYVKLDIHQNTKDIASAVSSIHTPTNPMREIIKPKRKRLLMKFSNRFPNLRGPQTKKSKTVAQEDAPTSF